MGHDIIIIYYVYLIKHVPDPYIYYCLAPMQYIEARDWLAGFPDRSKLWARASQLATLTWSVANVQRPVEKLEVCNPEISTAILQGREA